MKSLLVILAAAAMVSATAGDMATPAPESAMEVFVADGRQLQAAIDSARAGQTIVLEAGQVYEGPFVLRARPPMAGRSESDEWITIRSGRTASRRAAGGERRVTPEEAGGFARLVSRAGAVITAEPRARHYRLSDLEVAPSPGVFLHNVIDLGADVEGSEDLPWGFHLSRLYVHGDPAVGSRRGLALNGGATRVTASHFSDFKEQGGDSQAICGWGGPGPYVIANNHLEAAGENVMFGGADPAIEGMVPSDIEIRGNHLSKPLAWRTSDGGPRWSVKNLLELKNARRVQIVGNVLEHSWADAQTGFAVLFTPRNQDGDSPWSVVEDVTFQHNLVRRVGGGVHLLGSDDIHDSGPLQRVRITNNLFVDVGGEWGAGRLFQIINGTSDLTIDHNTALHTGPAVIADAAPNQAFVFRDNIVQHNEYGIIGSGTSPGSASIARYFPGAEVDHNVIVGGRPGDYPGGNLFPASIGEVGFIDAGSGDLRLGPGSSFRGAGTGGRPPGVDLAELASHLTKRESGTARPREGMAPLVLLALSTAGLLYVYVGYPGVVWLAGRIRPRPVRAASVCPTVSILVVVHNEAARVVRRIRNLQALRYPPDRREIVVASDGSTDDTAAQARRAGRGVRVIEFTTRRGKAAVFNSVVPTLRSDVVVLADARQRFDSTALEALVTDFADPSVGAVTGELVLTSAGADGAAVEGTGLYWRYEKWLRAVESRVDSCIGMTGAIAAIRRRLFEPLPEDTILDDLLIPLRIARRGYRVVFESRARAYDGVAAGSRDEFTRKVRTLAGNFQLFVREPWLLHPARNPLWVQTCSHKALRLAIPALLLAALVSNLWLLDYTFFRLTMAMQIAFYVAAAASAMFPALRARVKGVSVPYTICFLSCATVVAFVRVLRHREHATWKRAVVNEPA